MKRKLTSSLLLTIFFSLGSVAITAQTVCWCPYLLDVGNASVQFPGVPQRFKSIAAKCSEVQRESYSAYLDGALFTVYALSKRDAGPGCDAPYRPKFEDEINVSYFQNREGLRESKDSTPGDQWLVGTEDQLRIVDDKENSRWYALEVHGEVSAEDAKKFLGSLSLKPVSEAIEIGDRVPEIIVKSSSVTAESQRPDVKNSVKVKRPVTTVGIQKGETKALEILNRSRVNYTDLARFWGIQGQVSLRVTFGADGKIGKVVPISVLPAGLLDRAIEAARAMTFKPALKDGVPYSVTKPVVYTFTIY